MKPRVMSLVIFTCAVGLLTSNSNINITDAMIGIILVALGAGAAGCLNMWYEADLDALMTRTCLRPIPTGKINKHQALVFGILLSIFSVGALNYFANTLSAALLLFTIFFLFVCLHNMVKKNNTPKYCHRRCSRFIATGNWLDYSAQFNFSSINFFIFNNFFLDTFSFLGIEALQDR